MRKSSFEAAATALNNVRCLNPVSTLSRDLFDRRIDTTTLYHVTTMLWYHLKHQLLLNKMQSFLPRNKIIPWLQESLAKTPNILALVAHIKKRGLFSIVNVLLRPGLDLDSICTRTFHCSCSQVDLQRPSLKSPVPQEKN